MTFSDAEAEQLCSHALMAHFVGEQRFDIVRIYERALTALDRVITQAGGTPAVSRR